MSGALDGYSDVLLMRMWADTLAELQEWVKDRPLGLLACDPGIDEVIARAALLMPEVRKRYAGIL